MCCSKYALFQLRFFSLFLALISSCFAVLLYQFSTCHLYRVDKNKSEGHLNNALPPLTTRCSGNALLQESTCFPFLDWRLQYASLRSESARPHAPSVYEDLDLKRWHNYFKSIFCPKLWFIEMIRLWLISLHCVPYFLTTLYLADAYVGCISIHFTACIQMHACQLL